MSAVYIAAADRAVTALVDALAPLHAQLVGEYLYAEDHTTIGDVTHLIGDPAVVTITSVADGAAYPAPVTFPAIPDGESVLGVVVYGDDGTLVCYLDRRLDTVPLLIETTGASIVLTFNRLFKL